MKEKTGAIIAYCIGGAITIAALGSWVCLINAHDREIEEKKTACASLVSKVYSNSEEGRLAAEAVCNDTCMYTSMDELVNGYGLKEPGEIYQAAKRKCYGEGK